MVARAEAMYRREARNQIKTVCAFAEPGNINALLRQSGFEGEIDLLSIDIDSFDYWLWRAVEAVAPRVVVIEYNGCFGNELSVTVPFERNFNRFKKHYSGYYMGASLEALRRLGEKKRYGLVGCDSNGINAFFVRSDLKVQGDLKFVSSPQAYHHFCGKPWRESTEEMMARMGSHALVPV